MLAPDMRTRTVEDQERKATSSQLSPKNLTERADLGFGQKVFTLGSGLATFETDEEGLVLDEATGDPSLMNSDAILLLRHSRRKRGRLGSRRGDGQPLLAKQLCNLDLAPARWGSFWKLEVYIELEPLV